MKKFEVNEPRIEKIFSRIANIFFLILILFLLLTTIYIFYRIYNPIYQANLDNKGVQQFYYITIIFTLSLILFLIFGLLRFSNIIKINLFLILFSLSISFYSLEAYLLFYEEPSIETIAKEMGVPYDNRDYFEALNDFKNSGIDIYPNVSPRTISGLNSDNNEMRILGSIANIKILLNNELGYFPVIETDEFGFNNPKKLYEKNEIDIMLIGDSFTEGIAVNSDENIGSFLRELNFKTVSIGKKNNGPLSEYASLREYAKPFKPKIVIWLYFVNDLSDLRMEIPIDILKKYLDDENYSQNLILRQDEIDEVLKKHINKELENRENTNHQTKIKEMTFKINLINFIKLSKLRRLVSLTPTSTPSPLFKKILQNSDKLVSEWNGKLYFVYLPYDRYKTGKADKNRDFVMKTAKDIGLSIIDMHEEVFKNHPDPLSLFPFRFRSGGHYNAEGYNLIANAIADKIKSDGLSNLNY